MPLPNLTAGTAIDLGTLPNTLTQNVNDGGVTQDVWYKYTAASGDVVIGVLAFGDLTTYKPTITVFTSNGTDPYPGVGISATNVPIQMPVTAGTVYYFKIHSSTGNVSPASLSISGERAPGLAAPTGSLAVNDDTSEFPLAILSATDGSVLQFISPFPIGEAGDVLDNGILLVEDSDNIHGGPLALHRANLAFLSAVNSYSDRISGHRTGKFYVGNTNVSGTAKVTTVSEAGVVGATTWTLPAAGLSAIAASSDDTILYHAGQGGSLAAPIKRWDLVNNVALSDLVAGVAGYVVVQDLFVLGDSTILAGYYNTVTRDLFVRQYSTAGSTLNTFNFSTVNAGSAPRLARAIDDPVSFWVLMHLATGLSRVKNIRISDGATLTTFDASEFENGVYQATASDPPVARFGHSQSCPFFIVRTPLLALPSGTPVPVDSSAPCCGPGQAGPAGPAGPSGSGSGSPPGGGSGGTPSTGITPPGVTGPILVTLNPTAWTVTCLGGGTVPSAADLTDAENWAA